MKYSTGKDGRVIHSTGTEWDEVERQKKKRNSRVRYSTGRDSRMLHFTGTMTGHEPPDDEDQPEVEAKPQDKPKDESARDQFPWGPARVGGPRSAGEPTRNKTGPGG